RGRVRPARAGHTAVHPHSRGERRRRNRRRGSGVGSSPLAWGEVRRVPPPLLGRRFIPTRVGRGCAATPPSGTRTVHPHSRGERGSPRRAREGADGSSPLAWGEVPLQAVVQPAPRFIPTRVGRGPQPPA